MKNVVVCCDGTWNTPQEMEQGLPSPTNVVKLYNALTRDDSQRAYYHPGVGTGKGWWDQIAGGSTGKGLGQNIMSAYRWLGLHYAPGDRIFLFGFSRGAYTVRSLAGLIAHCGLIDLFGVDEPHEVWKRVGEVFAAYRKGSTFINAQHYPFHNVPAGGGDAKETTPVHFIGVWDTVGALGIPDDLAVLGLFDNAARYRFHETTLSRIVAHARHAVALDEKRASFAPTLWSEIDPATDAKQIWFPGVHSDVGGGYLETGLSDGALKWMLDEAQAEGLALRPGLAKLIQPAPFGVRHESYPGVFKILKTRPRAAPPVPAAKAELDASAIARHDNPPLAQGDYWPVRAVSAAGETVDVYAIEHWNYTGFYLEEGVAYKFDASGEWLDRGDPFPPAGGEGKENGKGSRLGDAARYASSLLGKGEKLFKDWTGRPADFWGTRRNEDMPWFALVGYVASTHGESARSLARGETFLIGDGTTFTPQRSGYLYCYANDAWHLYGNNRGSVALTVTPVDGARAKSQAKSQAKARASRRKTSASRKKNAAPADTA
jgi:hypothetical protein